MNIKFWEWVREYANKKIKDEYMRKYHNTQKCPQCNTWSWEVGGWSEKSHSDGDIEVLCCKKCGHESKWLFHGPCVNWVCVVNERCGSADHVHWHRG